MFCKFLFQSDETIFTGTLGIELFDRLVDRCPWKPRKLSEISIGFPFVDSDNEKINLTLLDH